LKPEFDKRNAKIIGLSVDPVSDHRKFGPDEEVQAMPIHPMSSGRNVDEVRRLLDAIQLTARESVATPVSWRPGQDVVTPASVSDEDAWPWARVSDRRSNGRLTGARDRGRNGQMSAPDCIPAGR